MNSQTAILVVEDSELFRRFLRLLLSTPDVCIIAEVANGLDAIAKAQEAKPDLVLLDIHLPDIDGLEVGKHIRNTSPGSKLLFVTEEASTIYVREALTIGSGYVLKSNAGSELPPAINAVLQDERFVSPELRRALSAEA